jgi:hypothetical protein
MGLLSFFWRNPTQGWPDHERTYLTIDLRAKTINGIPFGAPVDMLQTFGRPDAEKLRRTGRYVYPVSGLSIEVKKAALWWIGCDLTDAFEEGLSPATVRIATDRGSHLLRPDMTLADLTKLFGEPENIGSDTGGMDVCYFGPGYRLEFECSPEGRLRSVSVRGDE